MDDDAVPSFVDRRKASVEPFGHRDQQDPSAALSSPPVSLAFPPPTRDLFPGFFGIVNFVLWMRVQGAYARKEGEVFSYRVPPLAIVSYVGAGKSGTAGEREQLNPQKTQQEVGNEIVVDLQYGGIRG